MHYMIRTVIKLYGVVQTVGLRAQIKNIADRLGIYGSVENLPDGSVKIVCEAERTKINEMMRLIRSIPVPVDIKDMKIKEESQVKGMKDFVLKIGDVTQEMLSAMTTGIKLLGGATVTLNEIKGCQERANLSLDRIEKGQEHGNSMLKSIDNKLDMLLENDAHISEVLKGSA